MWPVKVPVLSALGAIPAKPSSSCCGSSGCHAPAKRVCVCHPFPIADCRHKMQGTLVLLAPGG